MSAPTYTTMLETAKQAYSDLLSGKISSYQVNGRAVTYQNIQILQDQITWLEGKAAIESQRRRPVVVAFRNPS